MIQFFLPGVIYLGIITSYTDLKYGKIYNRDILWALIYAAVLNILLVAGYFLNGIINKGYLVEFSVNLFFSILLGFGLWYFNVWSAADGKLFIGFAALIPLSSYAIGYHKWIPAITLIINTFGLSLLIFLFFILSKILKSNKFKKVLITSGKEFLQPKTFVTPMLSIFSIYWLIKIMLKLVNISNYWILLLVMAGIFPLIQKILKNNTQTIMILISLARLLFDKTIYSLSFLVNFLVLVFFWIFLWGFVNGSLSKLGDELFNDLIQTNKLKEGMNLGDIIIKKEKLSLKELKELKRQKDIEIIKDKTNYYIKKSKGSFDIDNLIKEEAEGINLKQIKLIKKLGFKKIRISQTLPFAPFMFIGVLTTIVSNGNFFIVLKLLFF